MPPVKVLYIIGTLDVGGSEGQLVRLATGLDRRRFEPLVCCLSSGGPYESVLHAAGIPVEVIGFRGLTIFRHPYRVAAQLVRLVKFLQRERPGIVHCFLFWAYILGTFAARAAGVPIVIASRRSLGHFKADKGHYLFLERIANRMTDLLVANSEAVRQDVARQEKLDPSRIRVIYNGIDPSLFEVPADPVLRASVGVEREAKLVGVIANFIHYKGHRIFLQACREVRRRDPGITFLLIGDGPCREELQRLAGDLGIEKDVIFLGARRDIPQLLALLDVMVLPSLEEGFPNAILEAMAAGKPVVATRVGGIPEAVIPGETGLLVPPQDPAALADAVLTLISNPALGKAMGRAGRVRVTKAFGLRRMIREMEALYEELLDRQELSAG